MALFNKPFTFDFQKKNYFRFWEFRFLYLGILDRNRWQ